MLEGLIVILLTVIVVVIFFGMTLSSTSSSKAGYRHKSAEDIKLRNMEDASGRFYVSHFHAPYYNGDTWEATVKAKERSGGYIVYAKGNSQHELENKIDAAYRELDGQWKREDIHFRKIGIDPDQYFKELETELLETADSVEITYTVMGYEGLGETRFDMDVKEKDYEWLQEAEEEEGILTSDYISENRRGLHKRIIKAIHNDMEDKAMDDDDGMVEHVVSGIHRKDFMEAASYQYASINSDADDIEYSVSL